MKKQVIALAALAFTLVAGPAAAADWTAMTGTVDFSGEETAIIAIVGSLFGFYLVRKGGRLLLSMIK
ncbi:hypothetical protein MD273_14190 [Marinobacter pelagius]|uniref:hypothetical protein n=1 Tax=Marinobacter sp. C7 TaxID=2951363 RepID=UPI001EF0E824|nr:hypothetical protein [Marinobacter sp. C7]MCG7200882.1 hypothetical protein [Marinobacter sp. C7]